MSESNRIYKKPKKGALVTALSTNCKTPKVKVKFSNVVNSYRYPNSPFIERFSITCLLDPVEHEEFIKSIQAIEESENVTSVLKNETNKNGGDYANTGNILIKFQTKERIPVYCVEEGKLYPIKMEDDFDEGEIVEVVYDIMRYTKRNTLETEHGINFRPAKILYYPTE